MYTLLLLKKYMEAPVVVENNQPACYPCVPQLLLHLRQYQCTTAFVVNQELLDPTETEFSSSEASAPIELFDTVCRFLA